MAVHALKTGKVANLRAKVSPEEWQARVDLAACYRLMDLYEMTDLIANHISMRVPGEPDHFLINAYGLLYDEITASSLLKIDHDGNILSKPEFVGGVEYGVNRAGFVIHSAIHMAKPDVNCIIHTHTWAGMAVSTMECGLLPNTQTSMRFANISYHDYEGVVIDTKYREQGNDRQPDQDNTGDPGGANHLRILQTQPFGLCAESLETASRPGAVD
jgi:ribulose-5-phosphate 4-epimerase/fuculose-1-phosphate aldolase